MKILLSQNILERCSSDFPVRANWCGPNLSSMARHSGVGLRGHDMLAQAFRG